MASVSTMDRAKGLAAGLMAGVFCACAATLLSSLWIVLFWAAPAHAFHRWYELPMGIFVSTGSIRPSNVQPKVAPPAYGQLTVA